MFVNVHRVDIRDHVLAVLTTARTVGIIGKKSPLGITIGTVTIDISS